MPRQRMIKPEFFDSESLAECSHSARLCFIGLWVYCDDNGNCKLNPKRLNRQIFPDDGLSLSEFVGLLQELERVGCIKVYKSDGDPYISVPNFAVYQKINRRSKSTIPIPPKHLSTMRETCYFDEMGAAFAFDSIRSAARNLRGNLDSLSDSEGDASTSEHSSSAHGTLTESSMSLQEGSCSCHGHGAVMSVSWPGHGAVSEDSLSTHSKEGKKEVIPSSPSGEEEGITPTNDDVVENSSIVENPSSPEKLPFCFHCGCELALQTVKAGDDCPSCGGRLDPGWIKWG